MKIAVLGTGVVGRAIAGRLAELGHSVVMGTRDPRATLAKRDPDAAGNPSFRDWHDQHGRVALKTFEDAAASAELVVLAGLGQAALKMLEAADVKNLAGKVLLDITNPLDFSAGFPPRLYIVDTDSLGEQIQRAYPSVRVVKSLNTLAAALMIEPKALGAVSSVFVCGNDAEAKVIVTRLLTSIGHEDVIDLGGIESARGTEMIGQMWMRVYAALKTDKFNFKIVR